MSGFLRLLWSGRDRRREPSASVQERIAAYSLRAAWDVKGTPRNPPLPKERPGA